MADPNKPGQDKAKKPVANPFLSKISIKKYTPPPEIFKPLDAVLDARQATFHAPRLS